MEAAIQRRRSRQHLSRWWYRAQCAADDEICIPTLVGDFLMQRNIEPTSKEDEVDYFLRAGIQPMPTELTIAAFRNSILDPTTS
jgi:hypothetical protein